MECWGASGGLSPQGTTQVPGRGGYTKGTISLGKITFYVYVGGQGYSNVNIANKNNAGGWNGGGASSCNNGAPYCGSGGGGSTDIRITKHSYGEWGYNSSTGAADASFRTRIMVAAGGGGCDGYYGGGHGGGTTGGTSTTTYNYTVNTGATQKATGSQTTSTNWRGYFGYANQVNNLQANGAGNGNGGGGGGGWWGGSNGYGTGGSGGSSFISGMSGCVAINSSGVQTDGVSTMTINGVSYTFSSPVTYHGGHASRPANPAEASATYGNGYAKITSQ